ncbi:P-loop containing nucleoside triphosphate hydrolases superfamily protein [Wolffia australiana]
MERIGVIVRARPLSAEDAKYSPWKLAGNTIGIGNQSVKFEFDRIFGDGCSTREVYEARTREIVASVVRGFNGTVFAYGQTNSGKTYTMRGSPKELGIIPLAVHDLFKTIEECTDREFLVRMSYMEIYNEEINDLLAPEHRRLQIHESLERGIFVAGLREEIVVSPEQIIGLMEFGEAHRHVGETNMNVHSSRSHTIFRMIIESRERTDDHGDGNSDRHCDAVRVSVLNLVDLAGSERAAKTGAEGVRLKEGSHINKSLMTLGTVIKKLSEGTESQGGHVPYRDSKLTRILQPALGGNSNTAIICNITLVQIHQEETKSSLQFASRAIRVKNFACVNEILTDAALLKRQQKQIEELQARLMATHSEHWEQEILNLRNTLLQSELEKERIALELEEEKKAKAQRERRLQEQEIKIASLSSMVLDTQRGDKDSIANKNTRRNTWCPGPLASKPVHDAFGKKNAGLQLPFEELLQEKGVAMLEVISEDVLPLKDCQSGGEYNPPDAHTLLHVTDRRKVRQRNFDSPSREVLHEDSAPDEMDTKISTGLEGCENGSIQEDESHIYSGWNSISEGNENLLPVTKCPPSRDSDVGLIDDELQGNMMKFIVENIEASYFEVQQSNDAVKEASYFFKNLFEGLSSLSSEFLGLKAPALEIIALARSISDCHAQLHGVMRKKNDELEEEKALFLQKHCELERRFQEIVSEKRVSEKEMSEMVSEHELEKDELVQHILGLQKEVSCLSSSFLAKEKEVTWKELERTKTKLKDTESKLKNAIQDKVRLESEKAQAEREIKQLHSQKTLLERGANRRESVSRFDSKALDFSKSRNHSGPCNQMRQVEVGAFEIEEIASLKENLMAEMIQKEEALVKIGFLEDELDALSSRLNSSDSELTLLREEIGTMALRLDESESARREVHDSHDWISRQKEEMAMQLTEALLEFETEKSLWTATEKALLESEERSKHEIAMLTDLLEKVKCELESCRKRSEFLEERLSCSEHNLMDASESSIAKMSEITTLKNDLERLELDGHVFENVLKASMETLLSENYSASEQINILQSQLLCFDEERARQRSEMDEISGQLDREALNHGIEKAKLRRMLGRTQAKLDAYRGRYVEAVEEMSFMNRRYEEASSKLKEKLASYAVQILNLKKQIAAAAAGGGD